jgi:hypothetical protein
MSNFLQHLVARTLGLAPVAQPRLPSLFETYSTAAQPGAMQSFTLPDADTTMRNLAMSEPGPELDRGPEPESEPAPLAATSLAAGELQRPDTAIHQPTFQIRSEDRVSKTDPGAISTETTGVPKQNRSVTVIQTTKRETNFVDHTPTSVGARRTETPAPDHSTLAKQEAPAAQAQVDMETRTPIAGQHFSDEQISTVRMLRAESLSKSPRALEVRPALRREGSRFAQNELLTGAESEPVINVTIGRVDVRAVYPQPQSQPSRRSVPAPMSLDEYLKQRRGGRK